MTTPSTHSLSLLSFAKYRDLFSRIEEHDSLRFNQKEKTTGAGKSRLSVPTTTRCHWKKIKDFYAIQGYDKSEILLPSLYLKYREIIAGSDAVRCFLEKPPIIAGGYQRFEIDSPVDRTHFKSVVQERADFKYSVFLSFRGADVRRSFTGHLVDALRRRNINDFIDNHEHRDEDLNTLFKRIEDSRIAIILFSSRYTESTWCLEELVNIFECERQGLLKVLPIYYKVTPTNVKRLKGDLCDHFRDKEYLYKSDEPMIKRWKEAIVFVLQKFALSFDEISHESETIEEIVEKAKRVLRGIPSKNIDTGNFGIKKSLKAMCKKALLSISNMCGFTLDRHQSEIIEKSVQRLLKEITSDGNFKPPQIQVFINFRGDQLRNNFIGYLVHALRRRKINVFIDNHEQRVEDVNTLFERIEDSGIAIVVFSNRYTESEWVMDELVKIVECERQGRLKVLPVFHNVSPSDVKRQKGEFGDHFRDKELVYGIDSPKIKQWKEAINYVSNKFPLTFDEKSNALEIDFIESIVKEVLAILQAISTVESGQSSN